MKKVLFIASEAVPFIKHPTLDDILATKISAEEYVLKLFS